MTTAMPMMGIDFGTCRSSAAVRIGREPHAVVLGGEQSLDIPTAIYIDPGGNILVGDDAIDGRLRDSTRYRDKFKLNIARDHGVSVPVNGANRSFAWADLV